MSKLTKAQQAVDDLITVAMQHSQPQPINRKLLRDAISNAHSAENLQERLGELLKQTDHGFADNVANAIFAAVILGYCAAQGGHS